MTILPVAAHLNEMEYKLLLQTYANHNRSMGMDQRANYTLSHIVKVERGNNCLHVHYSDGEWWHYTLSGKWY